MEQQINEIQESGYETMSHHEDVKEHKGKKEKKKSDKYAFETFEFEGSDFDGQFSQYLNGKYSEGWEYEDCQFHHEGSKTVACCIFERD